MKLTKYQHACFSVEEDGQFLIVDPGVFSTDFIAPANVVAVVITHQHPDHLDHDFLTQIINENPEVIIVAHPEVTAHIEVFEVRSVTAGETLAVGPFTLEFFGGTHATIHKSLPPLANLGVLINGLLYYPGDSFTLPAKTVDTLALPIAAPWMKISEAIDFLVALKPRLAFPTHDAILSEAGKSVVDDMLQITATKNNIRYTRLTDRLDI